MHVSIVKTDLESGDSDYDPSGTSGYWVTGGALFRLGSLGHAGAVLRYSAGDAKVGDYKQNGDSNAGGLHFALTLGLALGGASRE